MNKVVALDAVLVSSLYLERYTKKKHFYINLVVRGTLCFHNGSVNRDSTSSRFVQRDTVSSNLLFVARER
jgi:hypothetical protein